MESGHPNSDSPMEITRPMINDRIPPKYENRELSQINFKKNAHVRTLHVNVRKRKHP